MYPRSQSKGARSLGFQYPSPLNVGHSCKVFKPVGWAKPSLTRSGSTSKGGKTGEKNGACAGRPRLEGLEVEDYAALAFLAAVGRAAGFGWAFAAVFL